MEKIIKKLSENTELIYHEVYQKLCVKKRYEAGGEVVFKQLQALDIPNISKIFEVSATYTIFEYAEGKSLREFLEIYGELTVEFTHYIVCEMGKALKILHENHIVHKDIKPENVIISDDNQTITLIDFDVMRVVSSNKDQDTQLFGTRGYASPEHYGFKATDNRSDIYSLGMLMQDCSKAEILQPIIKKSTEIDPNNRYQTIAELLLDVENIDSKKVVQQQANPQSQSLVKGWENITAIIVTTFFTFILLLIYFTSYQQTLSNLWADRIAALGIYLVLALIPAVIFLTITFIVERFVWRQNIRFKQLWLLHIYAMIGSFLIAMIALFIGLR